MGVCSVVGQEHAADSLSSGGSAGEKGAGSHGLCQQLSAVSDMRVSDWCVGHQTRKERTNCLGFGFHNSANETLVCGTRTAAYSRVI